MPKPRAVCVYCGSSNRGPESHRDAAVALGAELAREGVTLVYGGGRVGVMGVLADAVLRAGGAVIGIIPQFLLRAEVGHGSVTELVVVDSMHERKRAMFERSDAFVILPGGAGTLDEAFEMLTWRQLGMHDKPIVVVNLDGYWDPLLALIERMVAAGYARESFLDLFRVVARVDDVLPVIAGAAPARIAAPVERL